MKKAILTLGIFSMMLVLTSFTSPQEIGGNSTPKSGGTDPLPVQIYEIGGNSTPKSGALGLNDIGGNSTPKSGSTGVKEIGGNSTPKSGAINA